MASVELQTRRDTLEDMSPPAGLTERQGAILIYLLQCWLSGFLPSIKEIADEFGIASKNGVVCHLDALKRKGYVEECEAGSPLTLADKAIELIL